MIIVVGGTRGQPEGHFIHFSTPQAESACHEVEMQQNDNFSFETLYFHWTK